MAAADATSFCPPHHWEVTTIRIDGVCFYHHRCKKCKAQKDIPFSAALTTRWVSRRSEHKT